MVPQYVTCIRCKLICFKYIVFFVCIKVYQFRNRSLKGNKSENLDLLSSILRNIMCPSFARQSFKFVLNVTDTRNKIIKVASTSVCLFWLCFVTIFWFCLWLLHRLKFLIFVERHSHILDARLCMFIVLHWACMDVFE